MDKLSVDIGVVGVVNVPASDTAWEGRRVTVLAATFWIGLGAFTGSGTFDAISVWSRWKEMKRVMN